MAMIMQRREQPEAAAAKMKAVIAESTEKLGKLHQNTFRAKQVLYDIYSQLPTTDQEEKKKLATSLFETFLANKYHLQPQGPDTFSMVSVVADEALLFAEEGGQTKIVGTVEKGAHLSVSRRGFFTEVYVPKIEKRGWLVLQDVTHFGFKPEVHKQIFEETPALFGKASTSSEKIDILQKQISPGNQ